MKISRRSLLLSLALAPVAALPFVGVKSRPSFPKGTTMMFQQTNPPSGWHELTLAEIPSHTHGCIHGYVVGVHTYDPHRACPKCGPIIAARKT